MGLTFTFPWALLLLLGIPAVVWHAFRGARGGGPARRRLAAALRTLGLLLAIGALAGAQLVRPAGGLTTVFLVDVSDSLGAGARPAARDWLRRALAAMPEGDSAGVVLFGASPMIERLPSAGRELDALTAQPPTGRSDIGAAIRLGLALLPPDRARRLVILSDGRDTEGEVERAARMAAAGGVDLAVVPVASERGDEVAISQVVAPGSLRQGDAFTVQVHVASNVATAATLRLYADGSLLLEQSVALRPGTNLFSLPVTAGAAGFRALRAEVEPAADTLHANNSLAAYTVVRGPARVLLVEGEPEEGAALAAALNAAGLQVERLAPAALPTNLPGYVGYDAVVLVDVPAEALGPRMELLQAHVRDLGKGLVAVGGEDSFGLGGYAGTPLEASLPVTAQLRTTSQLPQVALGLTLDKSGSMARCHAAPGETAASSTMQPAGAAKIDIAKEASLQSIRLLAPTDEVGIVAFDSQARWVAARAPVGEQATLVEGLAGLQAEGGTNIYAGLHEAVQSMLASQARVRHIILVTDGWSRTGNFDALLDQIKTAGITLSVVGAGGGASDFLRELAERGGGRYYAATDMSEVPRIFLKETKLALRAYIQEGRFTPRLAAPSPILDGIDALPSLSGYVAATARPAAQTVLVSEARDPLLAQWHHGLGRAVAWTSDAKGRWAADWVGWEGFSRFWAQTVKWTLASGDDLAVQATVRGDRSSLTVDSIAPGGEPRDGLTTTATLIGPDGARREAPLRQTAPGRYGADLTGLAEGAHLVTVTQRRGDQVVATSTSGLVVGYSPEYAIPSPGPDPLTAALAAGGGRVLSAPEQAFDRQGLAPASAVIDIWAPLLLLALLLLPLDIAVRRLTLGPGDLAALRTALATARRPRPARAPASTPSRLAAGKRRAQARLSTTPPRDASAPSSPPPAPAPAAAPPAGQGDTLARLRAARQRARRQTHRD